MKLLFDFLPIFLFFITYKFYGIYAATGVAIVTSLIQLAVFRIKAKQFESMHVITFFSILILGGATLFLHNEIFIKWKPTILYWLLGGLFFGSAFIGEKPVIQRLMENNFQVPDSVWRRLNWSWALFFCVLGLVNLFVVYHYSTNTWVNFKLFGILGMFVVFVVAQSLYMAKYIDLKTDQKS